LIAGLPVISYDVDGAREVTITGQTGILVPAQDVSALSEALEALALDGALRQRLGEEGQRRFTEQFDHRTMTAKVREVYLEQIAKR
jgi:glycosyltransferase involved in cell wall biosynthesis